MWCVCGGGGGVCVWCVCGGGDGVCVVVVVVCVCGGGGVCVLCTHGNGSPNGWHIAPYLFHNGRFPQFKSSGWS